MNKKYSEITILSGAELNILDDGNPDIVSQLKELSRIKYGREHQLVVRYILAQSRIGQLGKEPIVKPSPLPPKIGV